MDQSTNKKPIVITGFPYAFIYYGRVFDFFQDKEKIILVLPQFWQAKEGKVQIHLQPRKDIATYGLTAVSFGGSGIKGLFKGWMPGIPIKILYFRLKFGSRILYSCSEPHLLTTLWNGFFAKIFGYRHVLFTWQNIPPENRMRGIKLKLSNALVRLNLFFSSGIICGNQKAAHIIRKFKSENSKFKILVSPIAGVDTGKFSPGDGKLGRERFLLNTDEKIILFYGVLDDRKGITHLINAFANIHDNVSAKLIIVGTGPLEEDLKRQVQEKNLKNKVIFIDWLPNDQLPSLLRAADVFVYPSVTRGGWEEQFGYAMAEASACEVPVVSTRTGSIDEVVKSGQTGILVEPMNISQLSTALIKLLSDGRLRRIYGTAGRKYILDNFSHSIIATRIQNFLGSF